MLFMRVARISKVPFGWGIKVGCKGLEWILSCFANIRDWVLGKDYLCKRYRENNKFFKFRGRSNKVGLFVDIVLYYGGACRGCVIIPASSNSSGWCLFTKELDRFLSGENTVLVEGMTSDGVVGGGLTAGGGQNGKKMINYGNQWKTRNFQNSGVIMGHNVIMSDSTVTMEANVSHKPNKGGPEVLKSLFGQDKAQVANPKGKAHLEENKFSYLSGLGESLHSDQSMSGLSESSRLLVVAVASVVFVAPMGVKLPILSTNPLPSQVTELFTSISVVSHPDREVKRHFGDNSRITMEPQQPRLLEVVGLGLNSVMSTLEVMPLTSDYQQSLHHSQWESFFESFLSLV
nr:hypothetical protein CFP56_14303 [Quercus suber]